MAVSEERWRLARNHRNLVAALLREVAPPDLRVQVVEDPAIPETVRIDITEVLLEEPNTYAWSASIFPYRRESSRRTGLPEEPPQPSGSPSGSSAGSPADDSDPSGPP